jgi:hypothetical protein
MVIASLAPMRPRAVVVIPVLSLIVACSKPAPLLRADVEAYLRHANDWAPVEAETARTVDRILVTQFVDDAEVRRQVTADLPRVVAHLDRIRNYRPSTSEVRAVHDDYVKAWVDLQRGYASVLRGLDTGDASGLAAGRRAMEDWRATVLRTAHALRTLADRTGAPVDAQGPARP